MPATRIFGIGSHQGTDQAGWWLCDYLKKLNWSIEVDILTCRTPAQLPELMSQTDLNVLIDAIQTDLPVDNIQTISIKDLCNNADANHSSHGFGVTEALRLSYALGLPSSSVLILGVNIGEKTRCSDDIPKEIIHDLQQRIISWTGSPD